MFEVSHTSLSNRIDDQAISVETKTLEDARSKAKEFKDKGFLNIIIFDTETKKMVKSINPNLPIRGKTRSA